MANTKSPLVLIGNSVSEEIQTAIGKGQFTDIPASIGNFPSGGAFSELFHDQNTQSRDNAELIKREKIYVIQSVSEPVAESEIKLQSMVHTLKRYGTGEVTAILPFNEYERQDREFDGRFCTIGIDRFAKSLKAIGADRLITITPHSQAAVGLYKHHFGNRYTALSTTELFAEDIKKHFADEFADLCIGAPDGADKSEDEGQKRAKELRQVVFGGGMDDNRKFMITKRHKGVSETEIEKFEGNVKGRHCIIIDDMIDGGGTMRNAANVLKMHGAASVTAYATHGIFSQNALKTILAETHDGTNPSIDTLVITDTIPTVEQKITKLSKENPELAERVRVLSVGPMIAKEIERQHTREPGFADSIASISGENRYLG